MWFIVFIDLFLWLVVLFIFLWFVDVEDVVGLMIVLFWGVFEIFVLWGLVFVFEIFEKEFKKLFF